MQPCHCLIRKMELMNFVKHTGLTVLIFVSILLGITAQEEDRLPKIVPTATKLLENQDAPAGFCMDAFVEDDKGRFWIKPCGVAEQFYALHLIQFDGYEFKPVTVTRSEWNGFMRTGLEGFSSDLGVYGFLNRYPEPSALYRYLPGLDSVVYTPLENGIFGGVIKIAPGEYWVLTKLRGRFVISAWDGSRLSPKWEIPNSTHYDTSQKVSMVPQFDLQGRQVEARRHSNP